MSRSNGFDKVKKVNLKRFLLFAIPIVMILAIAIFIIIQVFNSNNNSQKVIIDKVIDKVVVEEIKVSDVVVDKSSIELLVGAVEAIKVKVEPDNAANKTISFLCDDDSIAGVDTEGKITAKKAGNCKVKVLSFSGEGITKIVNVVVKEKPVPKPVANTKPNTTNNNVQNLTYIKGILVVNKTYALPSTYNPGANGTAMAAFNTMKAAAANEGLNLFIVSGFRSYSYQAGLYSRYVSKSGQAQADRYSARAGHSEHQTGLAFDLNSADSSFAGTTVAVWLANNSYKYGFVVRYPKGKESITGYMYEPWHMRYLGVDNATQLFNSGLCLEEFLNIDSKYK